MFAYLGLVFFRLKIGKLTNDAFQRGAKTHIQILYAGILLINYSIALWIKETSKDWSIIPKLIFNQNLPGAILGFVSYGLLPYVFAKKFNYPHFDNKKYSNDADY